MLPISRIQITRDWMAIFTVLVWATVIAIMFLAKLKTYQDVLVAIILGLLFGIWNADSLLARFHIYKVYRVLRGALYKECIASLALVLGCLVLHGMWPDARAPGVVLHLASLAAWAACGVHTSPMVTCGLWAGGKNQMRKKQVFLFFLAQVVGSTLAFAVFALWYSFRLPSEGPFVHFFSLESAASAVAVFGVSVAYIRVRDDRAASKAE